MNIHEYQAKQILSNYGVPIPRGVVVFDIRDVDELIKNFDTALYVIKAQIHAGGRGKAGGVKVVSSKEEAKKYTCEMFGKTLITDQTSRNGQVVNRVYIESGCDNIQAELYLSAVLDRTTSRIVFCASTEGGINIEDAARQKPEKVFKLSIDPATGLQSFHSKSIAYTLGLSGKKAKQMIQIVDCVYNAFIAVDAIQIEINPLVVTTEEDLIALDAKMRFDDNALFRHPEITKLRDIDQEDKLELKANRFGLSYVRMDGGDIGCMVNGAGLAMATMDIIQLYGGSPANFLDIGGSANKQRVKEAFKIILSDKSVKGILVNIFGGIMRCDIVSNGLVDATKELNIKVPLVVRLAGTNFEIGQKILATSGLKIIAADQLGDAAKKIVNAIY